MSLDSVLNFTIPIAVFFFLGAALYKGLKEPIDKFIEFIKDLIRKGKGGNNEDPYREDMYAYYPKY
tara:strand:+ start:610 stop:807 length:198 start_codon:yes stop_codon:yes gene_type:complete